MILKRIWVISKSGLHLYSWKLDGSDKIDEMLTGTSLFAILNLFHKFISSDPVKSFMINDFLGILCDDASQATSYTVIVLAQIDLETPIKQQIKALSTFSKNVANEFRKTCSQNITDFAESHLHHFKAFNLRCIALVQSFQHHNTKLYEQKFISV